MSGNQSDCFVAQVVHRPPAGQRHRGRPQRVVRRRHQHLVAAVEQRVQAHHDQLGRAVAQVDVVDADAGDVLFLRVVHHRLARREQALAVGVAGRMRQVADHVLHDLVRRLQAEHRQVADVQLDDLVALFLHLPGLVQHRAADVVAHVVQLAGLQDGLQRVGSGGWRQQSAAPQKPIILAPGPAASLPSPGQPLEVPARSFRRRQHHHAARSVGPLGRHGQLRAQPAGALAGRGAALGTARIEDLQAPHFEQALSLQPELVIFGSGPRHRFVSAALLRGLIERRHRRRDHGHRGGLPYLQRAGQRRPCGAGCAAARSAPAEGTLIRAASSARPRLTL